MLCIGDLELSPLILATGFLLLVGSLAWFCLRRFERNLVFWI